MKMISQIVIVILAVALVAGVTYLIVTQTDSSTSVTSDRRAFDGERQGRGNGTGPGNGRGLRGGESEGGTSSLAWLEVLKNVLIMAVAIILISLIKPVLSRKSKPKPKLVNG